MGWSGGLFFTPPVQSETEQLVQPCDEGCEHLNEPAEGKDLLRTLVENTQAMRNTLGRVKASNSNPHNPSVQKFTVSGHDVAHGSTSIYPFQGSRSQRYYLGSRKNDTD